MGAVTIFIFLLAVSLALHGCGKAGPGGGQECAPHDMRCRCQADCKLACNNFNITTRAKATSCASCFGGKCTDDVMDSCPTGSCIGCVNSVSTTCWIELAPIDECVESCIPPKVLQD